MRIFYDAWDIVVLPLCMGWLQTMEMNKGLQENKWQQYISVSNITCVFCVVHHQKWIQHHREKLATQLNSEHIKWQNVKNDIHNDVLCVRWDKMYINAHMYYYSVYIYICMYCMYIKWCFKIWHNDELKPICDVIFITCTYALLYLWYY